MKLISKKLLLLSYFIFFTLKKCIIHVFYWNMFKKQLIKKNIFFKQICFKNFKVTKKDIFLRRFRRIVKSKHKAIVVRFNNTRAVTVKSKKYFFNFYECMLTNFLGINKLVTIKKKKVKHSYNFFLIKYLRYRYINKYFLNNFIHFFFKKNNKKKLLFIKNKCYTKKNIYTFLFFKKKVILNTLNTLFYYKKTYLKKFDNINHRQNFLNFKYIKTKINKLINIIYLFKLLKANKIIKKIKQFKNSLKRSIFKILKFNNLKKKIIYLFLNLNYLLFSSRLLFFKKLLKFKNNLNKIIFFFKKKGNSCYSFQNKNINLHVNTTKKKVIKHKYNIKFLKKKLIQLYIKKHLFNLIKNTNFIIYLYNIENIIIKNTKRLTFEKKLVKRLTIYITKKMSRILLKGNFHLKFFVNLIGWSFKLVGLASVLTSFISQKIKSIKSHWVLLKIIELSLFNYRLFYGNFITGCKFSLKGKINNSSRTRKFTISSGRINQQTFSSVIDYSQSESFSLSGIFTFRLWLQFS